MYTVNKFSIVCIYYSSFVLRMIIKVLLCLWKGTTLRIIINAFIDEKIIVKGLLRNRKHNTKNKYYIP